MAALAEAHLAMPRSQSVTLELPMGKGEAVDGGVCKRPGSFASWCDEAFPAESTRRCAATWRPCANDEARPPPN
jgi:hypothetical protein